MSRTRSLMEEEIIRVAIQCFSERGYQNTTLDDIVSQVNISRVTFYTYFKSKETLLKTIFERVNTTYQQGLEEIFAQPLSCREKFCGAPSAASRSPWRRGSKDPSEAWRWIC